MNRFTRQFRDRIFTAVWVALWALAPLAPISADVVFLPPAKPKALSPVEYADSSFGQAPARPNVRESRRPAGMVYEGQAVESSPQGYKIEASKSGNRAAMESKFGQSGSVADLVPNRRKGVQEVALIAGDLGYFPRTVFVTRNIPVRLYVTGASTSTLCIMLDNFNVRKQIRSKKIEEVTFTPTMPGKYRFYCPVNGMEGTLVVKEMVSQY